MKLKLTPEIWAWIGFVVVAFIGAGIGTAYGISFLELLRGIFGAVYVLFIPGYVVVRCFFNDLEDWIEKVAVSFGLSIAVVILSVIIANLVFRIPITALSNFLIILAAMVITVLVKIFSKRWLKKKPGKAPVHKD